MRSLIDGSRVDYGTAPQDDTRFFNVKLPPWPTSFAKDHSFASAGNKKFYNNSNVDQNVILRKLGKLRTMFTF